MVSLWAWFNFFWSLFGYHFVSLLVPGNNFNWKRTILIGFHSSIGSSLFPLPALPSLLFLRFDHAYCIHYLCSCMGMNESSSKLRIKVYYFYFFFVRLVAFFLLIYTIIFTPLVNPVAPRNRVFQKPSSDCLRIVASLQFEFLPDLHKKFQATQFYGNCCLLSVYSYVFVKIFYI